MDSGINSTRGTVIIADDLTGACDAAVYFAEAGERTYIGLHFDDSPAADWEVCAINTDTRCSSPAEAAARTAHACENARKRRPRLILKKIDSTMRGNISAEIRAARSVLQPRITLLTPAFPALGRTVRDGQVHIAGAKLPIGIAEHLKGMRCAAVPAVSTGEFGLRLAQAVEEAIAKGIDVLIPDTLSESDLRMVIETSLGIDGVLLAGSGGLAQALASTGSAGRRPIPIASTRKPLLICVGSDHGSTSQQLQHLATHEHAVFVHAGADGYGRANAALSEERNVVLLLQRAHLGLTVLREFAESIEVGRCGGLILTGGDTAMHILDALQARGIRSRAEVLAGIPQGEILGGVADGLPVITKSGAFGAPEALSRCVERLRTPRESVRQKSSQRVEKGRIQ